MKCLFTSTCSVTIEGNQCKLLCVFFFLHRCTDFHRDTETQNAICILNEWFVRSRTEKLGKWEWRDRIPSPLHHTFILTHKPWMTTSSNVKSKLNFWLWSSNSFACLNMTIFLLTMTLRHIRCRIWDKDLLSHFFPKQKHQLNELHINNSLLTNKTKAMRRK